jgi:hypothetical protein
MLYQAMNQGQRLMRGLLTGVGDIYRNLLFLEDLFAFLDLKPFLADPPTPAEVDAALKEVGLFQTFVAIKIEDRLGIEGLADVLMSGSFREMRDKVVREIHSTLRKRAEAEIKRLTGLSIRLGVPLKEQIRDFLKAEFSRLLRAPRRHRRAGGIVVSMIWQRIFNLIGKPQSRAARQRNLDAYRHDLAGFEQLRRRTRCRQRAARQGARSCATQRPSAPRSS